MSPGGFSRAFYVQPLPPRRICNPAQKKMWICNPLVFHNFLYFYANYLFI